MTVNIPFIDPDVSPDKIIALTGEIEKKECILEEGKNIAIIEPVQINKINISTDINNVVNVDLSVAEMGAKFIKVLEIDLHTKSMELTLTDEIIQNTSLIEADIIKSDKSTEIIGDIKTINENIEFNVETNQVTVTNKEFTCTNETIADIFAETREINSTMDVAANIQQHSISLVGDIGERIAKIVAPNDRMIIRLKKGWNYISIPYVLKNGEIARISDFIEWVSKKTNTDKPIEIVYTIEGNKEISYVPLDDIIGEQEDFLLIDEIDGELISKGLKVYSNISATITAKSAIDVEKD